MTLRIGIAGLVHDHVWGLLPQWVSLADAELVAIAEPNRKLWSKVVLQGPQPRFFPSWRDMLREARLDIIQITTENDAALPIVEAAAELGIAIMLEKPLAASLQDGERIYRAARAASVPFLVNWFTMWDPAIQTTSTSQGVAISGGPTISAFVLVTPGRARLAALRSFTPGFTTENGTAVGRWRISAATALTWQPGCSANLGA